MNRIFRERCAVPIARPRPFLPLLKEMGPPETKHQSGIGSRLYKTRIAVRGGKRRKPPDRVVFFPEVSSGFESPRCPNARFHDLRHSYAVAAIRAGDDIKTVQGNLGHATAAFTLDVYGHVTDQMKRESADRMERFICTVSAG